MDETHFYLLRTTTTQEDAVVDMLYQKAITEEDSGVYGAFHPAPIKGYVFMEARDLGDAIQLVQGVPHTKGFVKGEVDFDKEIQPLLQPKSTVLDVKKGDLVELVAGPFKGEKAKVIRVDDNKEEVTVELIEATVPIPVTAKGMHIKVYDRVTQEAAEVSLKKERVERETKGPVIGEGPLPALRFKDNLPADDDIPEPEPETKKEMEKSAEEPEESEESEETEKAKEKPKKIVLGAGAEEKKEESKENSSEDDEEIDEEKAAEEDANYFGGDDDDDPEDIVEKKKH
jgi:transcriptional antiterminator NusG